MKPISARRFINELLEIAKRDKFAGEWSKFYKQHRLDPEVEMVQIGTVPVRMAEFVKLADNSWEGWVIYPEAELAHPSQDRDHVKIAVSSDDRLSKLVDVLDAIIAMHPYVIHIEDPEVTIADIRAALTEISQTGIERAIRMVKFLDKGGDVYLNGKNISNSLK